MHAKQYFHDVVLAYEGDECLPWPYVRFTRGYGRLGQKRVSRLVCEHFYGPPPSPKHYAAHSCGGGYQGCCTKKHLRWASPKENKADELVHGTRIRGEAKHNAKLTSTQASEIRTLVGKYPNAYIAAQFGVSPTTVSYIRTGKAWAQ